MEYESRQIESDGGDGESEFMTVAWQPGHEPDGPAAAVILDSSRDYDLALKRRLERGDMDLDEFKERWRDMRRRIYRGEPITRQATL